MVRSLAQHGTVRTVWAGGRAGSGSKNFGQARHGRAVPGCPAARFSPDKCGPAGPAHITFLPLPPTLLTKCGDGKARENGLKPLTTPERPVQEHLGFYPDLDLSLSLGDRHEWRGEAEGEVRRREERIVEAEDSPRRGGGHREQARVRPLHRGREKARVVANASSGKRSASPLLFPQPLIPILIFEACKFSVFLLKSCYLRRAQFHV